MANIPGYSGATVQRGLPSIVWNRVPVLDLLQNPHRGHYIFEDFLYAPLSATTDPHHVVTAVNSSTLTDGGLEWGAVVLTSDTAENDGIQLQRAESFYVDADTMLAFGCRLKLNDATQTDFLVGLGITDTTAIAGISDAIAFMKNDGDVNIDHLVTKDSAGSNVDTTSDAADDTYVNLEFLVTGEDKVDFYVNNVLKKTVTTGLPNDEVLAPTIAFLTGDASANTMTVDYYYAASWLK